MDNGTANVERKKLYRGNENSIKDRKNEPEKFLLAYIVFSETWTFFVLCDDKNSKAFIEDNLVTMLVQENFS